MTPSSVLGFAERIASYTGMPSMKAMKVAMAFVNDDEDEGFDSLEKTAAIAPESLEVEDSWNGCSDVECCGQPIYMPVLIIKGKCGGDKYLDSLLNETTGE